MDLQSILKSFNVENIEQWHLLCATATLVLCVSTYVGYRLLFHKRSTKPKKSKNQKKRNDEKKTPSNVVNAGNSVKPPTVAIAAPVKSTKVTPKKQVLPVSEPSSKSDVHSVKVVPIKAVPKITEPEPKTESSSDTDEGQWIEVGKNKKDGKGNVTERPNKSEANAAHGTDKVGTTLTHNQASAKKRESEKKIKATPNTAKVAGESLMRTNYKPIEEPTFTQPSKPKRRSGKSDSDTEEEWQEVRFSRRTRKFPTKD